MKANFIVDRLNENGLFISEMNYDKSFQDKENPKGYFVMVIEPLEGTDKGIIYYQKVDNKFLIEGEGYILSGPQNKLRKEISKWISKYEEKDFEFIETDLK